MGILHCLIVFMLLTELKNWCQRLCYGYPSVTKKCGHEISYFGAGADMAVHGLRKLLDTLWTMLATRPRVTEEDLREVILILASALAGMFAGDYPSWISQLLTHCEIGLIFHILGHRTISLAQQGQIRTTACNERSGRDDTSAHSGSQCVEESGDLSIADDEDPGLVVDLSTTSRIRIEIFETNEDRFHDGTCEASNDFEDTPIISLHDVHADSSVDLAYTRSTTDNDSSVRNSADTSPKSVTDAKREDSENVISDTISTLPVANLSDLDNKGPTDLEKHQRQETQVVAEEVHVREKQAMTAQGCLAKAESNEHRGQLEPVPPDDTGQTQVADEPARIAEEKQDTKEGTGAVSGSSVVQTNARVYPTPTAETADSATSAVRWVPEQPPTKPDAEDSDGPKPQKRQPRSDRPEGSDIKDFNVELNEDDSVE